MEKKKDLDFDESILSVIIQKRGFIEREKKKTPEIEKCRNVDSRVIHRIPKCIEQIVA